MKNEIIEKTVEVLRLGKTILYPTDTIWGIGCDARNAEAVERLYAIKGRDRSKSMLVLAGEIVKEKMMKWIGTEEEGRPTTYILPREVWQTLLGDGVVAGNIPAMDGTLGVRVPDHAFCQEVIRRLGAPLVSTSANLSGRPSPAKYVEIERELVERMDYCVPPLSEFETGESRGSRIVRVCADGSVEVIRA